MWGVPYWGPPIVRMIICWGLYRGPLIHRIEITIKCIEFRIQGLICPCFRHSGLGGCGLLSLYGFAGFA